MKTETSAIRPGSIMWTAERINVSRKRLSQRRFYRAIHDLLPGKVRGLVPKPDLDLQFRTSAAWMLRELKQKAKPAIPDLIAALEDSDFNRRIRELAARTLFEFGPDAKPAGAALTQALSDLDETVVECAARALGAIGPAAKNSLPALKAGLGSRRDYLTVALVEAIIRIDAEESDALVPMLRECVEHTNAYSRVYGSQVLWNVGKESRTVVPVLMNVVADPNQLSLHQWGITVLGEIGPAASNAVSLLESKISGDSELRFKVSERFGESIRNMGREAFSKITNAP